MCNGLFILVLREIVGLAPFQLLFYDPIILFYAHADFFFKEVHFFIIIIAFVVSHCILLDLYLIKNCYHKRFYLSKVISYTGLFIFLLELVLSPPKKN